MGLHCLRVKGSICWFLAFCPSACRKKQLAGSSYCSAASRKGDISHLLQELSQIQQCSSSCSSDWCSCVKAMKTSLKSFLMIRDHQCFWAADVCFRARLCPSRSHVPSSDLDMSAALVPDGRDVLGPLSVQSFCPLLQLVQLVLDHLHSIAVSALFGHGLHRHQNKAVMKLRDTGVKTPADVYVTLSFSNWVFFMA